MTSEEEAELLEQMFTDGTLDGIPIDMEDMRNSRINFGEEPEYDFSKKLGITDHIYLDTGIDLRFLKRFNPKNHIIL